MLLSLALELAEKINAGDKIDVDGIFERVVFTQQERCVEELADSALVKISERFDFERPH